MSTAKHRDNASPTVEECRTAFRLAALAAESQRTNSEADLMRAGCAAVRRLCFARASPPSEASGKLIAALRAFVDEWENTYDASQNDEGRWVSNQPMRREVYDAAVRTLREVDALASKA